MSLERILTSVAAAVVRATPLGPVLMRPTGGQACMARSRGVRYRDVAGELGMTEGATKVAVHRMRTRFGELPRSEVAETLDDPADVDEEIRGLFAGLGRRLRSEDDPGRPVDHPPFPGSFDRAIPCLPYEKGL